MRFFRMGCVSPRLEILCFLKGNSYLLTRVNRPLKSGMVHEFTLYVERQSGRWGQTQNSRVDRFLQDGSVISIYQKGAGRTLRYSFQLQLSICQFPSHLGIAFFRFEFRGDEAADTRGDGWGSTRCFVLVYLPRCIHKAIQLQIGIARHSCLSSH